MLGRMFTKTAQSYFGGKRSHLAQALKDEWSVSAVYLWKGVVPLAAARKLEEITDGKLQVIPDLYTDRGSIASPEDKILPDPDKIKPKHKPKRRRVA